MFFLPLFTLGKFTSWTFLQFRGFGFTFSINTLSVRAAGVSSLRVFSRPRAQLPSLCRRCLLVRRRLKLSCCFGFDALHLVAVGLEAEGQKERVCRGHLEPESLCFLFRCVLKCHVASGRSQSTFLKQVEHWLQARPEQHIRILLMKSKCQQTDMNYFKSFWIPSEPSIPSQLHLHHSHSQTSAH